MGKLIGSLFFLLIHFGVSAQLSVDSISSGKAAAILRFLASDSLKGRGNHSGELAIAADFIANRFGQAGLKPFPGLKTYFHPFTTNKSTRRERGNDTLQNVIGVLEGKKKSEAIIFCAHYDHLGVTDGTVSNGANDNASGTTALLLLADYFTRRGDNERTLIFCAFAGEELGLLGSKAFAPFVDAERIVAVVNIEMIGIPALGKNAFFITGSRYSNLGEIFRRNLGKQYKIRPEPDYSKELFLRSDNYPFALTGIPAHTIMASDDDDRCYHLPCDDADRIDIENMTRLIRAIALGSETLISGKDTPTRIRPEHVW